MSDFAAICVAIGFFFGCFAIGSGIEGGLTALGRGIQAGLANCAADNDVEDGSE